MAARQPNNELVADLLARAGDPDIRQAAARDLHKLTRTIIGLAVIADDIMAFATIDESLRQASAKPTRPAPSCASLNAKFRRWKRGRPIWSPPSQPSSLALRSERPRSSA